jgi:hypothetical protein
MAPAACSLNEAELREQLARYRAVVAGADLLQRSRQRLVIRVGDAASDLVVEETDAALVASRGGSRRRARGHRAAAAG